jgi:hypothetical protein
MKKTTIASLIAAPLLVFALAMPSFAADATTTTCKDGTTTTSTGKGTCSGHGGIQKASKAKPATATTAEPAPAATPSKPAPSTTMSRSSTATKSAPAAAEGNTDSTGATAKCKDGTYSKSTHHSGTCSHHGGVAQWLNTKPSLP